MINDATLPLSLIVITRNEAAMIGQCLDSVPFAAEKIVVDCGSTDGTQELAAAHGAKLVHQSWLGFGPQRNFATTLASYDWILVLDADEALTPELARELAAELPALQRSGRSGAFLRRVTWYMGAPMRWYRPMTGERIARLYHRRRARWTDASVHEALRFNGHAGTFRHPVIHRHDPTLVHKQLKLLRYAELKARDWLDRRKPVPLWTCPFIFVATFLKDYFLRLAFLDGWRGYIVAQTAAAYAVYKRMRYFEMRSSTESFQRADDMLKRHGLEP